MAEFNSLGKGIKKFNGCTSPISIKSGNFLLFSVFSHEKYDTILTINDESIDGLEPKNLYAPIILPIICADKFLVFS